MAEKKIKIRLKRSLIGSNQHQIRIVKGLGLKKTNSEVQRVESATIMGMLKKVAHLVEVIK